MDTVTDLFLHSTLIYVKENGNIFHATCVPQSIEKYRRIFILSARNKGWRHQIRIRALHSRKLGSRELCSCTQCMSINPSKQSRIIRDAKFWNLSAGLHRLITSNDYQVVLVTSMRQIKTKMEWQKLFAAPSIHNPWTMDRRIVTVRFLTISKPFSLLPMDSFKVEILALVYNIVM